MGVAVPQKNQKITSQVFLSPIIIPITWTMVIKKKPYTTIVPKNNSFMVLPNARYSPSLPQRASIIVINDITLKQKTPKLFEIYKRKIGLVLIPFHILFVCSFSNQNNWTYQHWQFDDVWKLEKVFYFQTHF